MLEDEHKCGNGALHPKYLAIGEREPGDDQSRISSETVSVDPDSLEHRTRTGGWQVVSSREHEDDQPILTGMLSQAPK